MSFIFSQEETKKIVSHFGQTFYKKILKDLDEYSLKWKLKIIKLIDYYSINCIFVCHCQLFGDVILKICNPSKEVFTEINTLQEYNGGRFCKIFDFDIENGVILEELIKPGIQLRNEKSLDTRLSVFSSLYNGLHIKPSNAKLYPTYIEWVCRITDYMSKREDYRELYLHMEKAKHICMSVNAEYPKQMLLHGDFHHDNILLNSNNEYKIIDPKGVIGDPVFDVSRFILNEFEGDISQQFYDKILYIISFFEKSLNIPSKIIKQCFYVDTVMSHCWNVQSNTNPNFEKILFAENIMNSQ